MTKKRLIALQIVSLVIMLLLIGCEKSAKERAEQDFNEGLKVVVETLRRGDASSNVFDKLDNYYKANEILKSTSSHNRMTDERRSRLMLDINHKVSVVRDSDTFKKAIKDNLEMIDWLLTKAEEAGNRGEYAEANNKYLDSARHNAKILSKYSDEANKSFNRINDAFAQLETKKKQQVEAKSAAERQQSESTVSNQNWQGDAYSGSNNNSHGNSQEPSVSSITSQTPSVADRAIDGVSNAVTPDADQSTRQLQRDAVKFVLDPRPGASERNMNNIIRHAQEAAGGGSSGGRKK